MVSPRLGNWPVLRLCCHKLLPVVGSYFISLTLITGYFCQGLKIVEVAHDISQSVSSYISRSLKLVNSYDTWHGILFSILVVAMTLFLRNEECGQVIEDYLQGSKEAYGSDLVSTACGQTYTCPIFFLLKCRVLFSFFQRRVSRFTCTGP